jgi:OOP family OmpA-OmpF porin
MFLLAYSGSFASDEAAQESVDPSMFDRQCEDLMKQVAQQSDIRFPESSAELGSNAHGLLDEIVEIVADCPSLSITVTGHADNTGNESFNRVLSRNRAAAVVAYLIDRGIESRRLTARGAGSETPIASNDNAAGRQINRRIEFETETVP